MLELKDKMPIFVSFNMNLFCRTEISNAISEMRIPCCQKIKLDHLCLKINCNINFVFSATLETIKNYPFKYIFLKINCNINFVFSASLETIKNYPFKYIFLNFIVEYQKNVTMNIY